MILSPLAGKKKRDRRRERDKDNISKNDLHEVEHSTPSHLTSDGNKSFLSDTQTDLLGTPSEKVMSLFKLQSYSYTYILHAPTQEIYFTLVIVNSNKYYSIGI